MTHSACIGLMCVSVGQSSYCCQVKQIIIIKQPIYQKTEPIANILKYRYRR